MEHASRSTAAVGEASPFLVAEDTWDEGEKMKIATLALLILGCVGPSFADYDGNELLSRCAAAQRTLDQWRARTEPSAIDAQNGGFCLGLVYGVSRAADRKSCMPTSVSGEQAIQAVRKFLIEHPERLGEPDYLLVVHALGQAYPCKAK